MASLYSPFGLLLSLRTPTKQNGCRVLQLLIQKTQRPANMDVAVVYFDLKKREAKEEEEEEDKTGIRQFGTEKFGLTMGR